jgi:hypothetical protein
VELEESINAKIEKIKCMTSGYGKQKNCQTANYFFCYKLDLFQSFPAKHTIYLKAASGFLMGTPNILGYR